MTDSPQPRTRARKRLWQALAVVSALLAVLIIPPFVSVQHYKRQITQLLSASLGRPVRLGSVEVRLLPRPGFLLTDLTVDEDPAYGAEPLLHANSVTASIRLLSLWQGRLEIGTISVDEASLNLARNREGRWNLDSLFRTAAVKSQANATKPAKAARLPYLEATNSRINVKNGDEKLPFSLLNTEASFWQQSPGDWRIRLRGQPARTDVTLQQADTGLVRLEASLQGAPELRKMPVHLDLEWRDAQLGQLSRLVIGSDPGWRGDLTGELHLSGTAETAVVNTRLRATGVHRAEFAPVAPLDFDARCGLTYHQIDRAFEKLTCDSPLGDGHLRLSGDLPANANPNFTVELDRIPVTAGLDILRTMRSGFADGLQARGTLSGKLQYAVLPNSPQFVAVAVPTSAHRMGQRRKPSKAGIEPPIGPLTGSIVAEGFELSGNGLSEPVKLPRLMFTAVPWLPGWYQSLKGTVALPAGGGVPLAITSSISLNDYEIEVRGQASVARGRELAHLAGLSDALAPDGLTGGLLNVDLKAHGPWLPVEHIELDRFSLAATGRSATGPSAAEAAVLSTTDALSGTVELRNVAWKTDFLANPVEISTATLTLGEGYRQLWEPVVFSYGQVKGTGRLFLPSGCTAERSCPPTFQLRFATLDLAALQAAILGAHEKGTLLSSLIERLHPSQTPAWPTMDGEVKAAVLVAGPVTLKDVSARVRIQDKGAEISNLAGGLLGGRLQGRAALQAAASEKDKPTYRFDVDFEKLSPAAVGLLVNQHWVGSSLKGMAKIEASGYEEKELTASARGTLHFDWLHGQITGASAPAALARFDSWSAEAEIANGAIKLQQNQLHRGPHESSVEATATMGTGASVKFAPPKELQAKQ